MSSDQNKKFLFLPVEVASLYSFAIVNINMPVDFYPENFWTPSFLGYISLPINVICTGLLTALFFRALYYLYIYPKRGIKELSQQEAESRAWSQLSTELSSDNSNTSHQFSNSPSSPDSSVVDYDSTQDTRTLTAIATGSKDHNVGATSLKTTITTSNSVHSVELAKSVSVSLNESPRASPKGSPKTIPTTPRMSPSDGDINDGNDGNNSGIRLGIGGDSNMSSNSIGNGLTIGNSEISVNLDDLNYQETVRTIRKEHKKQKEIKIKSILRITWYNKVLLLSSLFWSNVQMYTYIFFIISICMFNNINYTCADRGFPVIFYALQRFSLMSFFVLRLYFSFKESVFKMHLWWVYVLLSFLFITYFGGALYYVIAAYITSNDSFSCEMSVLIVPIAITVVIDILWNLFLGLYFLYKLKQVCTSKCVSNVSNDI